MHIYAYIYNNRQVNKSIKFQQQMDQPTIYEKSITLVQSGHTLKQILMSCIIYSSSYYPITQPWLVKIICKCCNTADQQVLLQSIQQLIQDLNREIVYGPSAAYAAVSEKPHRQHLDSCFIREGQQQNWIKLVDEAKKLFKQSWILQFVEQKSIQQLLWYRRSNFLKLSQFINKKVNSSVLKQLQVNGQSWIKTTPLPTLLLTLQNILKQIIKNQNINPKFYLLLGRIGFLHNKILQNPSKQLADSTLSSYRKYIAIINKQNNKSRDKLTYVSLLLEYVNVLLFYYKYSQCQKVLDFCKTITNLQLQYTGKMGRRTKYQSFDTAQLVMNIKNKSQQQQQTIIKNSEQQQYDKDAIDIPNAKQLVLKQMQAVVTSSKGSHIDTSHFDQQNILLQRPKYVDQQPQQKDAVSIQKILVTLSIIQYMWQTTPKDQILYQQIATSIQTILQHKQKLSYSIMFNVLLLRSLNEFPRIKNVERALDQLQKLKLNFNQKSQKDTSFMYTYYTPYFQFIKTIAQKYMEIGMTMTAIQLYEKVGMIEECIDGLIAKSYKEKALALAQKYQKQNGKTPRLLCMLGDLQQGDKCIQYYTQAWNLSDKRNARSQRSLGWHYFRKKEYLRAAQSFRLATQANFYHPNTWFTLGCCYMQLKQFQKAIPAFGQCVCIDQTQGQAWGNIATCYIYQNRNKEAYSTLEQALKHSQKSWKMWSNMLSISLKIKKFYKYFECIEKLVLMDKSELINAQVLQKITKIFQYQQDNSQRRRLIQAMKNRLDRLYKILVQKIGQNPIVWNSIYQYNLELQSYTIQNYKHYKKLHEQGKIDKNDLLQGYETIQQMQKFVQQTLSQLRQNIVSSKQTQLNMTMKIGWQSNKKLCEQITTLLQQYVSTFLKYANTKDEKNMNQFNLFIKGVQAKIEACLEKPITINFTTK